jgi:hypothetical protein
MGQDAGVPFVRQANKANAVFNLALVNSPATSYSLPYWTGFYFMRRRASRAAW